MRTISTLLFAACASGSLNAATVTLNFEDGQLPSASGWAPVLGQGGNVQNSIVTTSTLGAPGNQVLRMSGTNRFGWYFDLTGNIDPTESWDLSVDVRRVSSVNLGGGGINDIGINVYGTTGRGMNIGSITDTLWHTFAVGYDATNNTYSSSIDGVSVGNYAVSGSSSLIPTQTTDAISFIFSNINVVKTAEFEYIQFTYAEPTAVPLPAGGLLLGASLFALSRRRG